MDRASKNPEMNFMGKIVTFRRPDVERGHLHPLWFVHSLLNLLIILVKITLRNENILNH